MNPYPRQSRLFNHSRKREIVWKRKIAYCVNTDKKFASARTSEGAQALRVSALSPVKFSVISLTFVYCLQYILFLAMPGAISPICGCSTSRRRKEISIFKIPSPNSESNKKWRRELLSIVTKDIVVDENLRRQTDANEICICEKHFYEDQFWISKWR